MTLPAQDTARLAEIAEREKAATKAPWFTEGEHEDEIEIIGPRRNCRRNGKKPEWVMAKIDNGCFPEHREEDEANAEFIAAARTDIPYLLGLVERLSAQAGRYEEALDIFANAEEAEWDFDDARTIARTALAEVKPEAPTKGQIEAEKAADAIREFLKTPPKPETGGV